ncbi:DUF6343 family protein [uncultured Pseudokineococcus sp.]|uniref:DUF6343 family protein n=1 Tax=uncultured Pseudokineococcus sp. TaxID=1642928 RepID=UPI0026287CFD|nr:DUF6343 family protein [uncultured Pseudokineococcus sp.]
MSERPEQPSTSGRRSTSGQPRPPEPRYGLFGEAPTHSALTLRAILAVFGLLVCAGLAAWAVVVDAPTWMAVALGVLAVVAVVDLVVIGRRKARGEPG